MTSSVSGQDEPNLPLCLATRLGKMELSCPLGIRALSRKENPDNKSFIDQACSITHIYKLSEKHEKHAHFTYFTLKTK